MSANFGAITIFANPTKFEIMREQYSKLMEKLFGIISFYNNKRYNVHNFLLLI